VNKSQDVKIFPQLNWWQSRHLILGRTDKLIKLGRTLQRSPYEPWQFWVPPGKMVTVFETRKAGQDMDGLPFLDSERFRDFMGWSPLFTEGRAHEKAREIMQDLVAQMGGTQQHFIECVRARLLSARGRKIDLTSMLQEEMVRRVIASILPEQKMSATEREKVVKLALRWLNLSNRMGFFLEGPFRRLSPGWGEMKRSREALELILGDGDIEKGCASLLLILAGSDNPRFLILDVLCRAEEQGGLSDTVTVESLVKQSLTDFPPTPLNLRIVDRESVVIDGHPVAQGSAVALDTARAGLQWGHGNHACLGARQARSDTEEIMEIMRRVAPELMVVRVGASGERFTPQMPRVVVKPR